MHFLTVTLDMFSVCEVKLLYCINEENAIDLLTYADGLQAQILYGKCVQYITSHTTLFNSDELKDLSPKIKTFIEMQFARYLATVCTYNLVATVYIFANIKEYMQYCIKFNVQSQEF